MRCDPRAVRGYRQLPTALARRLPPESPRSRARVRCRRPRWSHRGGAVPQGPRPRPPAASTENERDEATTLVRDFADLRCVALAHELAKQAAVGHGLHNSASPDLPGSII